LKFGETSHDHRCILLGDGDRLREGRREEGKERRREGGREGGMEGRSAFKGDEGEKGERREER
jgi:hypothetical protein